ncbi:T6SS phospholipase effector Tle1-like catalytic domain-containing protein [Pseudoduganella namucuonensis]|nr:DUF2235 domain-containing protein [Pseudoduganella namucuonensis]
MLGKPGDSCKTNLFFGFFFDGTKNNYVQAEAGKNHSNVARLYDIYPGLSVPGVLPADTDWQYNPARYTHFFKVYVPGVASPFKEINDSGQGLELTRGAAAGFRGEARIVWGLIQAINNVHRYFLKTPLLSSKETQSLVHRLELDKEYRRKMTPRRRFGLFAPNEEDNDKTRLEFEKILKRLHAAVSQHWPNKRTGKPAKLDPAQVMTIYISTFGFSRGATQARAFTNWLMALCKLDAHLCGRAGSMTLGGFDVQFDFLGLFDTVASVGAGNTMGNSVLGRLFDGHGDWADAEENLRIPAGLRCVHLVAAHEIRRSFPLDSVSVGQVMPEKCDEVVIPGVHSDLGCGYSPQEQGRGTDPFGEDMLARVPLLYMYREARLAGVPLKLELASPVAKRKFRITAAAIKALNDYLAVCQVKTGTLTAIMREQGKHHILWHRARRSTGKTPLESTASFQRATNFDKNDLHSANLEFEQEIAAFEAWQAKKGAAFVPRSQEPGFDNEHENEWEEIATWWKTAPPPPAALLNFFDDYVHDSRAWFKLHGDFPDNEPELQENLKKWEAQRKRVADYNAREQKAADDRKAMAGKRHGGRGYGGVEPFRPLPDGLTDNQRQAAIEYAKTNQTPRMLTEGREPWSLSRGGYLRFRKVYAGRDSVLISKTPRPEPAETAVA